MRNKIKNFVNICLDKYSGGESYFTELDRLIKNDSELLIDFIETTIKESGIKNVVISGEIGRIYYQLKQNRRLKQDIMLCILPGGLRFEHQEDFSPEYCEIEAEGKDFIFIDDSYYSGKTVRVVQKWMKDHGGKVVKSYVFYDGSYEKRDDVVSLYRYWDHHKERIYK